MYCCGNYGNLLSHFFDKNFVKVTFLLLAGPKAQPTSVRHQIRILDIFATFDALFEKIVYWKFLPLLMPYFRLQRVHRVLWIFTVYWEFLPLLMPYFNLKRVHRVLWLFTVYWEFLPLLMSFFNLKRVHRILWLFTVYWKFLPLLMSYFK